MSFALNLKLHYFFSESLNSEWKMQPTNYQRIYSTMREQIQRGIITFIFANKRGQSISLKKINNQLYSLNVRNWKSSIVNFNIILKKKTRLSTNNYYSLNNYLIFKKPLYDNIIINNYFNKQT